MHHPQSRALDTEQLLYLRSREFRHRDDAIRFRSRPPCLVREALPEFQRGIVPGEHEQVMEGRDRAAWADRREPLIESMEELRAARRQRFLKQEPPAVG